MSEEERLRDELSTTRVHAVNTIEGLRLERDYYRRSKLELAARVAQLQIALAKVAERGACDCRSVARRALEDDATLAAAETLS